MKWGRGRESLRNHSKNVGGRGLEGVTAPAP